MEEMNKLRRSICEKNNREYLPVGMFPTKIDWTLGAAQWLRHNGHTVFTNQSFRGLLEDITGKEVSQEEATLVRVLTGVPANLNEDYGFNKFVTSEELDHIKEMIKAEKTAEHQITITETGLGWYVEVVYRGITY